MEHKYFLGGVASPGRVVQYAPSPVTQDLINAEIDLQKALHKALRREEQYWRIKARCLWLKEGDKNTSFFHKHAEAQKNYNSIREIHYQDQTLNKFEEI